MKQKLWKAIEAYRMSGGREEHWRNRDVLDILLDEALEENARVLAANRDVMVHFNTLKHDYDMLVKQQTNQLKPCRSPYCECDIGKCTHPGFYDARGEQAAQPVAYRSRLKSGSYTYCNTAQFFDNAEPLYTAPLAQPQPVTRISVQDALPKAVRGVSYNARLTDEWCDHSWSYEGHSHNDSFYVCTHCKKEEWR